MGFTVWGVAAFALFLLNDVNDWRWGNARLRFCFPLGSAVLAAATAGAARGAAPVQGAARWALAAGAAAFLALLVYTLFFALPAGQAYGAQGQQRAACTTGVYALCRHPGVLWFAGLYLCLTGCTGLPLGAALLYSGLNLALVAVEDRWVFPARLAGYAEYQASTPFLLPNARSLRACFARRP